MPTVQLVRRLPPAVAAAAVAVVAYAGPAAAAPAPISQCTTTSGVILAVDFGHWGGPVLRACGTTPTTGYALLNQGGWHSTGTLRGGPAFVCRISFSGYQGGTAYPTAAEDPCAVTSPASASWSYWHADPGASSWTYSSLGAMSYQPRPGSVDLWTFGPGTPSVSPDSVRAHNTGTTSRPKPPPASSRPPASTPPAGGGGGAGPGGSAGAGGSAGGGAGAGGGGGAGGGPGAATGPGGGPAAGRSRPGGTAGRPGRAAPAKPGSRPPGSAAATTPAATPGAGGSPAAAGSRVVDVDPTSAAGPDHSGGSAGPAILTGAIVLALGSAAGITLWRRRAH
jgi:hypothetical protein